MGDDVLAVVPREFISAFYDIVKLSGMVLSSGKDLPSRTLMILCEDHTYVDRRSHAEKSLSEIIGDEAINPTTKQLGDTVIHYLDVIKVRLLVGSGRIYADHRAAMIGKSMQLANQLAWHPIASVKRIGSDIFRLEFERTHGKGIFVRDLPYELPPIAGGFSLPRLSWEAFKGRFDFHLRFLWGLLDKSLEEFLTVRYEMSRPTNRRTRGVEVPKRDLTPIFKLLSGFNWTSNPLEDYDSEANVLYGFNDLQAIIKEKIGLVPVSIWSGRPIFSLLLEYAGDLGLLSVQDVISVIDKMASMEALFEGQLEPANKSFAALQRRTHRFWKAVGRKHAAGQLPLPATHGFKDFGDIAKRLSQKGQIWVRATGPIGRYVGEGPHLRVRLLKHSS